MYMRIYVCVCIYIYIYIYMLTSWFGMRGLRHLPCIHMCASELCIYTFTRIDCFQQSKARWSMGKGLRQGTTANEYIPSTLHRSSVRSQPLNLRSNPAHALGYVGRHQAGRLPNDLEGFFLCV